MLRQLKFSRISLTQTISSSFALRTHQETLIRKVHKEELTRQQMQTLIEQPNKEQIEKQVELKRAQEEFEQQIRNLPFNDSNPNNYLKIQIKPFQERELIPQKIEYLVPHKPKTQKILVTGMRRECPLTVRKIFPYARPLIGKHIYEAIELINQNNRKAATYILSALKMVKSHAVQKGLDEERLFVQSIITNKLNRFTKVRYHAKSKMGRAKRDTSQIRVTLEERPAKDLFKNILSGSIPTVLTIHLKQQMIDKNASLERINQFQYILTAKGRQQARLMIKRRAQQIYLEKKEEGKLISLDYLINQIIEEKAQELANQYEQNKIKQTKFQLSARQTTFKKNEETHR